MATYWKSQPKKFCDFCKCWITDNKPSVDFHEKGKKHQENVKRKIDEVRKKGMEDAQKKQELDDDMRKMEEAALAAFKKDLEQNPELAAQYNVKIKTKEEKEAERRKAEEERKKAEEEAEAERKKVEEEARRKEIEGEWFEAKSDEGYTYYWNTVTSESIWEAPKEYVSLDEQKKREEEEKIAAEIAEEKRKAAEYVEPVPASSIDPEDLMQNFGPQLPQTSKKHVYGSWITLSDTVVEEPPEPEGPVPIEDIPLPEPPKEEKVRVEKPRFKEKRVTSLSEGQNVTFKKRKVTSGARNVRQRDSDN